MKTLFILRHAKSSWDNSKLDDFDRPLNKRGKAAATFMGELMKDRRLVPDIILASPAKRAKKTARRVKKAAGFESEINFDMRIYEAAAGTLLEVLFEHGGDAKSVLLVGHNPAIEGIVAILTKDHEAMPTAALAVIDLDIGSWEAIEPGKGTLRMVIRPREEMKAAP